MTGMAMNRNILLDVAYSSQKCYIYGLNRIHIRIQQLYSYIGRNHHDEVMICNGSDRQGRIRLRIVPLQ